jgi:hypothetical protein
LPADQEEVNKNPNHPQGFHHSKQSLIVTLDSQRKKKSKQITQLQNYAFKQIIK